jgi:hypothetical protein
MQSEEHLIMDARPEMGGESGVKILTTRQARVRIFGH